MSYIEAAWSLFYPANNLRIDDEAGKTVDGLRAGRGVSPAAAGSRCAISRNTGVRANVGHVAAVPRLFAAPSPAATNTITKTRKTLAHRPRRTLW